MCHRKAWTMSSQGYGRLVSQDPHPRTGIYETRCLRRRITYVKCLQSFVLIAAPATNQPHLKDLKRPYDFVLPVPAGQKELAEWTARKRRQKGRIEEADVGSHESHLRSPYNHNKLRPGIPALQGTPWPDQEGRVHEEEETNAVEVE